MNTDNYPAFRRCSLLRSCLARVRLERDLPGDSLGWGLLCVSNAGHVVRANIRINEDLGDAFASGELTAQ